MGIYGDPWHITATFLQDTRHASHLHDDAPDVRERARPNRPTLPHT